MALNGDTLKGLIKTKIEALNNFPVAGQSPVFIDDRVLGAIAEAIVEHITTDAQLAGTAAVASGSSAGSWPVTGQVT